MPRKTDRARLLAGKAPRRDAYHGHTCAVADCDRTTRAMSRYCQRHAQQYFRTRNPAGRLPRRSELKPYREIAEFALEAYGIAEHPAWRQSCEILEQWVSKPDAVPEPYRAHLRRLYLGGATGHAMLMQMLPVYGLRYIGLPDSFTDDCVFFACLGSRFLRTVRLSDGTRDHRGKKREFTLPGRVAETFGRALAEKVGILAISFWRKVEKEDSWRTAPTDALRDTLEQHPL